MPEEDSVLLVLSFSFQSIKKWLCLQQVTVFINNFDMDGLEPAPLHLHDQDLKPTFLNICKNLNLLL